METGLQMIIIQKHALHCGHRTRDIAERENTNYQTNYRHQLPTVTDRIQSVKPLCSLRHTNACQNRGMSLVCDADLSVID